MPFTAVPGSCGELHITVQEHPFKTQKGVYTIIKRNRFIFLKEDLDPVM